MDTLHMAYQILVVEDTPDIRELYERLLRKRGFEVTSAVDGEEALHQLEANPPDLMVTDINLPRLSGIDLLKHARLRLKLDNMKIIVASANSLAVHSEAMRLANAVLQKPVDNRQLVEKCKELLNTPILER